MPLRSRGRAVHHWRAIARCLWDQYSDCQEAQVGVVADPVDGPWVLLYLVGYCVVAQAACQEEERVEDSPSEEEDVFPWESWRLGHD